MMPYGRQHHVPLAALLFATLATAAQQRIAGYSGFSSQRDCARNCFLYEIIGYDFLGYALGCGPPTSKMYTDLADVSCYCRQDLETLAHEVLSQCISNAPGAGNQISQAGCGGVGDTSVDEQTAIKIYDGYCATVRGPSTGSGSSSGGSSNSTG